ncbi:MAG: acyl-CoA dehydrogenase [Anaerolineae bacterium]|nr:MAG: acyl-CoA dehydrogenase [Anaerolineae bacterium]
MKTIITPQNLLAISSRLAQECASRAAQADKDGKLPEEDLRALREVGYLALSVPLEYGGAGLSLRECAAAQVELARGSAATALVAAMQIQVFGHAREMRTWPEDAFARFCQAAVREGALFNSVASEPDLGSPSRGARFRTTAVPAPGGDHFIVNGHKTWVTGGHHLTHLLVRVSIASQPAVLWMPNNLPGMTWLTTWRHALSLRASESHDLRLENVVVPAENLLERGAPKSQPPNLWFPAMLTAVYLGAALAARDAAIRYALERVPTALGRPIASLPSIQRQIGEIDLALQAARALFFEAASAWDGNEANRAHVMTRLTAAKCATLEAAAQSTEKALRLVGGQGLLDTLPVERHFRDVRAGFMQPPAGDAALESIGRAALESAGQAASQ